jgi:acid phosphatase (class A)
MDKARRIFWIRVMVVVLLATAAGALPLLGLFDHPAYLSDNVDSLVSILPPPPADDSAQTRAEIDELRTLQTHRTPEIIAFARANQKKDIEQFAAALGLETTRNSSLKKFRILFAQVEDDIGPYVRAAKVHFKRRRPFLVDETLTRCLDGVAGDQSYPSGHATFGWTAAYLLADMSPDSRAALMARAEQFAQQRAICGVHYASDLEAGRRSGEWLANRFLASPAYRSDAAAAASGLRSATSH